MPPLRLTGADAREEEILRWLEAAGATGPASARPGPPPGTARALEELLAWGAVVRTADGRFWMDPVRARVLRQRRRGAWLSLLGIAIFLLLLLAILVQLLAG